MPRNTVRQSQINRPHGGRCYRPRETGIDVIVDGVVVVETKAHDMRGVAVEDGDAGAPDVVIGVVPRDYTCYAFTPLFSSLTSFPTILSHALTGPAYYPFPLTHILSHDPRLIS